MTIVDSQLFIKKNNKYYVRILYSDNYTEVYSLDYIIKRIDERDVSKNIKEKYDWLKLKHPELFI